MPCFQRRYFTSWVGESSDNGVFSSYLSPRKQMSLIQTKEKRLVECYLNNELSSALGELTIVAIVSQAF